MMCNYTQFMGKDNTPFHTIVFPASLLASRQNWTLLKHINTTEYLNYEDQKFSKSRGTGVFGDEVQKLPIQADVWRYYMLFNRPEVSDSVFMWDDFAAKNNTDLANNLGNFVQRSLSFVKERFKGVLPLFDDKAMQETDKAFVKSITEFMLLYVDQLDKVKIKDALKTAMAVSRAANQFMQDAQVWELVKTESTRPRCYNTVCISVNVIHVLALLLQPYMPKISQQIGEQLNFTVNHGDLADSASLKFDPQRIKSGHVIGSPVPLFRRIDDAEAMKYKAQFGGAQEDKSGAEFPLHIVVGKVTEAKILDDAPHVLVVSIDIGAAKPITIASALRPAYSPESIKDMLVCVLQNVKHSKYKGVMCEGLLLVSFKTANSLFIPDTATAATKGVKPGDTVLPAGCRLTQPIKAVDARKDVPKLKLESGLQGQLQFGNCILQVKGKQVDIIAENRAPGAKLVH